MDNVVYLLKSDPLKFWHRVTGRRLRRAPRSTARSYVRSLLFLVDDSQRSETERAAAAAMLATGIELIGAACGGFAEEGSLPVPNLIQGWTDDDHLRRITRSTPLVVSAAALASSVAMACALRAFGWHRGPGGPTAAIECWVYQPRDPTG
jgi:hypothetical protein